MKENFHRKSLVFAIMVLFVSAGFIPGIGGDIVDTSLLDKFSLINEKQAGILEEHTERELDSILKDYFCTYCQDSSFSNVYVFERDPASVVPNDPDFYLQWALDKIDAPEAWDIEQGNESIVIAVVDTGVDWDHPDLEANMWVNDDEFIGDHNGDGYPGIQGMDDDGDGLVDEDSEGRQPGEPDYNNDLKDDDDENGYVDDIRGWDFADNDNDPMDDFGHGTRCAGIASAVTNNGVGIAGVCWNVKIMPVKVLKNGTGYPDPIAKGIRYAADNGAHVVSMSFADSSSSRERVENAVDYAYDKGVVLVAAAGNDNISIKRYPAGYDNVIAIAGTDEGDIKYLKSNYGSWIDVAAPGVDIYSTYLDDDYDSISGTSFACAHVAGLVGLILSRNPGFNQEEIATILRSTTDKVYSTDYYIGVGRINAYNAICRDSTPIASLDGLLDDSAVKSWVLSITGTASGITFKNYTVWYGTGVYPGSWTELYNSSTSVVDDVLAEWNIVEDVTGGIYTIRLTVTDFNGHISEDRTLIILSGVYVDDDFGPWTSGWGVDHFDKIQDGIDAVTEHETVFVSNGTYYEANRIV